MQELKNLQHLDLEIQILQEKILEIRTRATHITPNVKTFKNEKGEVCIMPGGGGGTGDKMLNDVCELLKQEEELEKVIQQRNEERKKIFDYIKGIKDSQLRQIFLLRFLSGLSWKEVAKKIGGGNTADSVKKQVYRFITKK